MRESHGAARAIICSLEFHRVNDNMVTLHARQSVHHQDTYQGHILMILVTTKYLIYITK